MKPFNLIILFLLTLTQIGHAQNRVADTHPGSVILAIDYSTNQQVPAVSDNAILFKDAFIDLVSNTPVARMRASMPIPGRRSFVITQLNPQTSGDSYQLVLQSKFLGRVNPVYTFIYDADQNTLSYYNPGTQSYIPQNIDGPNLNNLNNCYQYGNFNAQGPQQGVDPATQGQPVQDASFADDNTAVDTSVSVATVPPALPDYEQPECPVDGYLWQPGYWAYSLQANGYYWVPGAWVEPPTVGYLWTPPYWGFVGNVYVFHRGYWGNTIGFYGGIDYGYGYGGVGFVGGNWYGGHFRYNTAVVRVNVNVVHNTYVDRTVYHERGANHASFNGRGGYTARPNSQEIAAGREHHVMATSDQIRNQRMAREDKTQFASSNGGKPGNLAAPQVAKRTPNPGGQRPGNPGQQRPGNNNNNRPGMQGNNGGRRQPPPRQQPRNNNNNQKQNKNRDKN